MKHKIFFNKKSKKLVLIAVLGMLAVTPVLSSTSSRSISDNSLNLTNYSRQNYSSIQSFKFQDKFQDLRDLPENEILSNLPKLNNGEEYVTQADGLLTLIGCGCLLVGWALEKIGMFILKHASK